MKSTLLLFFWFLIGPLFAQEVPEEKVVPVSDLARYLKPSVQKELRVEGEINEALLAKYFREKFAERFFYDWNSFNNRFEKYQQLYPGIKDQHKHRAEDHMNKYDAFTTWKLPFNYKNGEEVDAYAIRHLARQHKMVDIAFQYNYTGDSAFSTYFTQQMQSLNKALVEGAYETIEDGNGVYEVFRSGYRILNWLWIHNMLLASDDYSDKDQLLTIATLLQHGAHLYNDNPQFRPGNHQTRGMSALAMLSILLRDFNGTDKWHERSVTILEEHLKNEINSDGFQFERTVHYHISDINNYFYVFQLAQKSEIQLGDTWEARLKTLFTSLAKIAYPDKSAPVLQDDTDTPWAEKNDISEAMSLGYLIFPDEELGYFAADKVDSKIFWFLDDNQLDKLNNIKGKAPDFKSVDFPDTGYYIMREGWEPTDKMMIISAGLDDKKPDHQHGDMLGIQAMANGKTILPNYQVRYSLEDLELFKNSLVKNVAVVDDELQGKQYSSNQGGSGFGKFKELPHPVTDVWTSNEFFDVFIGNHNGFENLGVTYSRQVIYIKDDFWIVKDNFRSDEPHEFKQIWQGHYTLENAPKLIRATFDNGSGLDILQLNEITRITGSGKRGKQWKIAVKEGESNFEFVSLVYPFDSFEERIISGENQTVKGWEINPEKIKVKGKNPIVLSKDSRTYFFSVSEVTTDNYDITFSEPSDFYINTDGGNLAIRSLQHLESQVLLKKSKCNGHNKKIQLTPEKPFICGPEINQ